MYKLEKNNLISNNVKYILVNYLLQMEELNMNKSKIIAIILSASMLASIPQVNLLAKSNNSNNIDKISENVESLQDACITNKSGDLKVIDTKGKVIYIPTEGEMIKVYSKNDDKTLIRLEKNGVKGYIESSNISSIDDGDINNVTRMNRLGSIINVSSCVNIRKGPSIRNDVIDQLQNGTNIRITGKTGKWYRVSVDGLKGFIFEEYVKEGQASQEGKTINSKDIGRSETEIINKVPSQNHKEKTKVYNNDNYTNHSQDKLNEDYKGNAVYNENNNGKEKQWKSNEGTNFETKITNKSKEDSLPELTTKTHSDISTHGKDINKSDLSNVTTDKEEKAKPSISKEEKINTETEVNRKQEQSKPNIDKQEQRIHKDTEAKGSEKQGKAVPQKVEQGQHKVVNPGKDISSGQKGETVHGQGTAGQGGIHTGEQHQGTVIQPSKPVAQPEQKPAPKPAPAPEQGKEKGQGQEQGIHKGTEGQGSIHKGEESVKPAPKKPMPAPTLTAHDVRIAKGVPFDYSLLKAQANEGAKVTYSGMPDTNKPGAYKVVVTATNSQGGKTQTTVNVTVVDNTPQLTAHNYEVKLGSKFDNSMLGAHAEGCNISYNGNVDTSKPGTYPVTITATNSQGGKATVTVNVKVVGVAPTISGNDLNLPYGHKFDQSLLGLKATSCTGDDLTSEIKLIDGSVDTDKAGKYRLTFSVTDSYGMTSKINLTVTVGEKTEVAPKPEPVPEKPVEKMQAPILTSLERLELNQGDKYSNDLLQASTNENAKITYEGTVDTSKVGDYKVTIVATNKDGVKSVKEVNVTVNPQPNDKINAPVLKVAHKTVTITKGESFSNDMFGASATFNGSPVCLCYQGIVDNQKEGTYHVTISAENREGLTTEEVVTVIVKANPLEKIPAPEITGNDVIINVNDRFDNSMLGAKATVDGKDVEVYYSGDVIQNKPGTYHVTVSAVNAQGLKSEKEFIVKVNDIAPKLIVHNFEMIQDGDFSIDKLNIKATAADGTDLSKQAKITGGVVNVKEPATYKLIVTVTDAYGKSTSQDVFVTVKARELGAPVIEAKDLTIIKGESFSHNMIGAKAVCNGEELGVSYSGDVDANKPGKYIVTVTATNKQGVSSKKEVTITVKSREEIWSWIDQSNGIGEYKGKMYYTKEAEIQKMLNNYTFQKINEFRIQQGKSAFEKSNAMDQMSHWKNDNMRKYDYYDHKCDGKNNPFYGLYTYQVFGPQYDFSSGWCENLAGARSSGSREIYKETGMKAFTREDIDSCASSCVNAWINSPSHRKNMLGDYKCCGVWTDAGISTDEYGNVYLGGFSTMNAGNEEKDTIDSGHLGEGNWKVIDDNILYNPIPKSFHTPDAKQSQEWAREHSRN